jgi:DNA-binding MarR family transcriptional regulator
MMGVYKKRFETVEPFTEEALLALARMSRGIFRRFLRYITLALDIWEEKHRTSEEHIDVEVVKEAVTTERLAADMDLELSGLFPKHSDLRFHAVQLIMHLQEHGPQKQSQLSNVLDIGTYSVSRLLTRLEQKSIHNPNSRRNGQDRVTKQASVSLTTQNTARFQPEHTNERASLAMTYGDGKTTIALSKPGKPHDPPQYRRAELLLHHMK